jgi:hypothetical protein
MGHPGVDLFVENGDLSSNTIERNRNLYYQRELANHIANRFDQALEFLSHTALVHLNEEGEQVATASSQIVTKIQRILSSSSSSHFSDDSSLTNRFICHHSTSLIHH